MNTNPFRASGLADKRITEFEDQTENELVVPEDLTALSDEDFTSLNTNAVAAFQTLYGDGSDLTADDLTALGGLTEGITRLQSEQGRRATELQERSDAAAELAAKIGFNAETATDEVEADVEVAPEDEAVVEDDAAEADVEVDEAVELSGRREVRVNLSGLARRTAASRPAPVPPAAPVARTIGDFASAAPDIPGFSNGQRMEWDDMGRGLSKRLESFNEPTYKAAAQQGRHMRQQFGLATIRKPIDPSLKINSNDAEHIEEVFSRAVDQSRLPGGSLVASGGWCAPSEVLYDLFEIESNDGLPSIPEVQVNRGGIKFTPGPDFRSIYNNTGFFYTETQDAAGNYNGAGGGSKPCYSVPCPAFTEQRLNLDGLCVTSGILQQRAYPEVLARTIRGSLIAHNHLMAGRKIASLVAQSTAVTMPGNVNGTAPTQAGALNPVLTSIELQVENYKYVHRMARGSVLEAMFPFWIKGAIRTDLAKRLGTDLDPTNVSDQMINNWFAQRGVAAQFVYDWQDIGTTAASGMTSWPTSVQFLLYAAGTFVVGADDVITLDTIYDSVALGQNNYTALFSEEGWLVAKRGHDSRVVTVPISPDGALKLGVDILADGTSAAI